MKTQMEILEDVRERVENNIQQLELDNLFFQRLVLGQPQNKMAQNELGNIQAKLAFNISYLSFVAEKIKDGGWKKDLSPEELPKEEQKEEPVESKE